ACILDGWATCGNTGPQTLLGQLPLAVIAQIRRPMMANYKVTWLIDVDSDSSHEAARQAMEIMRDPTSIATVLTVTDDQGNVVDEPTFVVAGEEKNRPSPELDDRELSTVLASLRYWQDRLRGQGSDLAMLNDIATNAEEVEPLAAEEIDALCQRLNLGPAAGS